ncbi:MAG: phosphoribosylformylglycinamidine synthase [Peptococcaceae bacterium BRH_c4a]|nr:MAG: phosphoribosylformylglycinamidine synthase [Peptococcaceae bacterium BRH_c4a]
MLKPKVCILRTDGTNCDAETLHAFEKAGGQCRMVHVNQLRSGEERLSDYQIMALPGGFSYGDDVHSGKILAVELTSYLKESLQEFVDSGKPVIGICNGFQVLVRTGLLPGRKLGDIRCTLMHNHSGRFECRWVNLKVEDSPCIFTRGMSGKTISVQVAHGEGKFYADGDQLNTLETGGQVVFRYSARDGAPTMSYPQNPNGSINSIAGICDKTGLVMGLMPHPERFVAVHQHPDWRRGEMGEPHGLPVFINAVKYCIEM